MSFPTPSNGEEDTCRRKTRTGSRWIYLRFFLIGLVANQAIQLVVNSLGAHPKPTTTSTNGGFHRALEEAHNDVAVQNYGEGGGSSSSSQESRIEHLEEDLQYNEVFVLCIGIGLILLTIAFEEGKEYLEDSVTEDMEPIVEKLFGEMTVLGFLSMVTFLFSEFGFFEFLSVRMFGVADEEEELLEITEVVHFGIFFIMVFFFIQVLVLIRQALKTEALWRQLDREIRFPETAVQSLSSSTLGQPSADEFNDDEDNLWIHSFGPLIRFWRKLRLSNSFISLFPYFRNEEEELKVNRMYFRALRQEFILERSIDPPFEPLPPSQQIDPSFSFGRYLGLCLVKFLANVVEVGAVTLVLFLVGDVMYFAYCRLVQERLLAMAFGWLFIGWFIFLSNVYFEKHVLDLRGNLVPEASPHLIPKYAHKEESDGVFKAMGDKDLSLPGWCSVDLDRYMSQERNWLRRKVVGGQPNRQETLQWMDRWGPTVYLVILQTNLMFIGLDFGMQLLIYLPPLWRNYRTTIFPVYLTMWVISSIGNMLNKRHLVATLAGVCSLGSHRRLDVIADVLREEKTENLVRTFLIIYRLRRFASEAKADPKHISTDSDDHYSKRLDPLEIVEVGKTFGAFDQNGNGRISFVEFEDLMTTFLGTDVPKESLERMLSSMDIDGNGQVSKEEFLQWYSDNIVQDDKNSLRQAPRELFALFDEAKNGVISIAQFKMKLDALRVGFSVDEQIAIVNEIDRHSRGKIGLHEFELLFRKFPPTELRPAHLQQQNWADALSGGICHSATCHAFA